MTSRADNPAFLVGQSATWYIPNRSALDNPRRRAVDRYFGADVAAALDEEKLGIYVRYIHTFLEAMFVTRTTVFQTNRSQAVRLPKEVALPADVREVVILRDGARRIIVPAHSMWDDFFDAPGIDIGERDQPLVQPREAF